MQKEENRHKDKQGTTHQKTHTQNKTAEKLQSLRGKLSDIWKNFKPKRKSKHDNDKTETDTQNIATSQPTPMKSQLCDLSPSIIIWNLWKNNSQQQTKQDAIDKKKATKRMTQSKLFNPNTFSTDNMSFGNNIKAHSDIKCIIFHNINGIKDSKNWIQINTTMKEMEATIFGFAETNTSFFGPHAQP
jgi:hypothetical protein